MTSSYTEKVNLLPDLQRVFPAVLNYEIRQTIEQASATGYVVNLVTHSEDAANPPPPQQVFVKQVVASRYLNTKKDWPDLRRSMLYTRTEARLYREIAPLLLQHNPHLTTALPKVYLADYNLIDWISEDEVTTDPLSDDAASRKKEDLPSPGERGGILILEYLPSDRYFQDSPLTIQQCHKTLRAIAQLHAAAWQCPEDVLVPAEKRLSRCSFHLSLRNPKELVGMEAAWEHFSEQFHDELYAAMPWMHTEVDRAHLGRRVKQIAQYVSNQVTVSARQSFATLVHGDYKAMNVFLPINESDDQAVLVDFASVGVGLGMSDVAMHVHHAIRPEDLDSDDGEDRLVRVYWRTLTELLKERDSTLSEAYSWDIALRHYHFAVVDYFRFFLGRFWKSSTKESMSKLRDNKNTNLVNRSVPAAVAFVVRVERYLTVVEAEMNN